VQLLPQINNEPELEAASTSSSSAELAPSASADGARPPGTELALDPVREGGMSDTAKMAVGLGTGLGVLFLVQAVVIVWLVLRRRKGKREEESGAVQCFPAELSDKDSMHMIDGKCVVSELNGGSRIACAELAAGEEAMEGTRGDGGGNLSRGVGR
jgi:hypothetical protein